MSYCYDINTIAVRLCCWLLIYSNWQMHWCWSFLLNENNMAAVESILWPWELNTLHLEKRHANRLKRSKVRQALHQCDNTGAAFRGKMLQNTSSLVWFCKFLLSSDTAQQNDKYDAAVLQWKERRKTPQTYVQSTKYLLYHIYYIYYDISHLIKWTTTVLTNLLASFSSG